MSASEAPTVTKVNLADEFGRFDDRWSPKVVADFNHSHVMLVKVQGEFVWHQHAGEDELYFVVAGGVLSVRTVHEFARI